MIKDPLLALIVLSSNIHQSSQLIGKILDCVQQISKWDTLPAEAEKHGMAPLVYFHMKNLGNIIPEETLRDLAALSLRHKLINESRSMILGEMVTLFQTENIPFLVLKGGALMHLLYPEPYLRPMKDLDILIRPVDDKKVSNLLLRNGFISQSGSFIHPSELHLPTFTRQAGGFSISLEVHHRLLRITNNDFWGYIDELPFPPLDFALPTGEIAKTLSKEDFLYHICMHSFYSYHLLEPIKVIWVADICNFSEKFKYELDWKFIKENYPIVLHTLSALHEIHPLDEDLIRVAKIPIRKIANNLIEPYSGWPGLPMRDVKKGEKFKWVKNTIFPSEWVLYLFYGTGNRSFKWYNWLKHIFQLIEMTKIHIKIRLKTKGTSTSGG